MNNCLYCSKEIPQTKTYCSEAHSKAYRRKTQKGEQPGQNDPDILARTTARTHDFKLTRTDSKFEDYKPHYYKFEATEHKRKCLDCKADFKTHLDLLKYCSPKCMRVAVQSKQEPLDEWYNSAQNKIQPEIESRYTEVNFPNTARYYTTNGGGSGAISPYKKDDPRHKAYTG